MNRSRSSRRASQRPDIFPDTSQAVYIGAVQPASMNSYYIPGERRTESATDNGTWPPQEDEEAPGTLAALESVAYRQGTRVWTT